MSNPSTVTYKLTAAVSNGVALSQAVTGAGPLTLAGSLTASGVATFDTARRVLVTSSSASDAGLVFTVTGTSRYGFTQTSTVALATAAGVTSGFTTLDFLTVTAIQAPSAAVGNITAGTNTTGSTDWLVDNYLAPNWSMTVTTTGPAGTDYSVETTMDDPCFVPGGYNFSIAPGSNSPPVATPNAVVNGVAGNYQIQFGPGDMCYAHRLTINSGTGSVQMQSIQAGIGSP